MEQHLKPGSLSIKIKNKVSELKQVNETFAGFAEANKFGVKVITAISMALDEIVTNIVSYGYDDSNEHTIEINIKLDGDYVTLEIIDDSRQFNPLKIPEADTESDMDERAIGGLGLHLVKNLMDNIKYTYKNGKNCLTMKKKVDKV